MRELQADKIAFIVMQHREEDFQRLLASLQMLQVPEGYHLTIVKVVDGRSRAAAYQQGMLQSDAKYKIYLDERTVLRDFHFLASVLAVFQADAKLGLLGLSGAVELPFSGVGLQAAQRLGKVCFVDGRWQVWQDFLTSYKEVMAIDGWFMATQYDVDWRVELFDTDDFLAASQSLEFRRRGYAAAVVRQPFFWLACAEQPAVCEEKSQESFWDVYGDELLPDGRVQASLQQRRDKIQTLIEREQYESALAAIASLGTELYKYNQTYTDEVLEADLQQIRQSLSGDLPAARPNREAKEKCVVFYDGFGLDIRGLARIYLDALGRLGFHIVYIVLQSARGKLPATDAILQAYGAESIYLSGKSYLSDYQALCAALARLQPTHAFLYATPWDVVGILAFEQFAGRMTRYQINLTDHAFWLGKYAFDYCIEFRDYGASVSVQQRHIAREKLVRLPFYPMVERELPFAGFPFERQPEDFVIFSGGALYKTRSREHTYYRLVDDCLREFPQVKFWYAGAGDDTELRELMARYPGRVFHTAERRDLFQLLQQADLYLSTYPLCGGLMSQYSALAGCPPFTLQYDCNAVGFSSGLLLPEREAEFLFAAIEDLRQSIRQFIFDADYRRQKIACTQGAVISAEKFSAELLHIMQQDPFYEIQLTDVDVTPVQRAERERYIRNYLRQHGRS